ncbi:hypothetical protein ACFE04_027642 [Oxalis oulophora]
METSPLSIESFSYSWLVNLKPSLESLDNSLRASLDAASLYDDQHSSSFIEMDPRMPPSKRFFRKSSQDFKFDFPISQSPLTLVDADELFSNGQMIPLFIDPLKISRSFQGTSDSEELSLQAVADHVFPASGSKTRCTSLRRCRTLSKRIIHKYLAFFRPIYRRIRSSNGRKSSSRVETIGVHQPMKNWGYSSVEASPRISIAYSADNWRRSCDSESSIYEAVLHCKKSIVIVGSKQDASPVVNIEYEDI